ncbi:hypothetical protein CGSMWGv1500E_01713 [Gardnerella vaginalis 1500E]|uniref:Uncharacterized protein n=1 Tax=Gardnerella vaginalis 1500E TaxID=698957 RepID=I4M304_GARVA|nr:hypothetical protein [Gardnerella vaginalis]EIK83594.1 hypothetical protein CGSMWGv1500E_01713 [Gardnerella vaginalis 1500E]
MDSNNLPNNNHSQNTEENNENQINDYTNNANLENTYTNNANQTDTYQNNSYMNSGYQNNANPANTYQNNTYQNNGYQNDYQNDYQNNYQNDYQNNWYQNDYQNDYQNNTYQNNGYQNNNNPINTYINSDNLIKTYKNVQQQVISFVNTTLADEHKKRIAVIVAIVLAVILFGGLISGTFKKHSDCSAEKSANIEEYADCHPSDFEERGDDDVSATFDAQGDSLNITIKFKDRVPDNAISKAEATFSDRLFLSNLFPAVEEAKNKVSSPIHLYYTVLNNDDSVIYKDDFIDE